MARKCRKTAMTRLPVFIFLVATVYPIHAEKARGWQTGKVLESGSQRQSQIVGTSNGPVDGTTTVDRRQWDSDQFVIDAGDRLISISKDVPRMGGSTISWSIGKRLRLVPGDAVQFALEKDSIYVLVDGKEQKLHVDRITLKPGDPAPASASTGISPEQPDAQFAAQLQQEFPEIVADSERMSRGLQPESEIFKCAGAIYRAAVAADPALKESRGALLMAARQAKAELKTGACAAH
jgi:hypothetical protein